MRRSEAMALVGVLEAACPHAKVEDTTRKLYAGKLERYDAQPAAKAFDALVESWRDWRLPPWPVVKDAIHAELRNQQRPELPVGLVPPPPDFLEAKAELTRQTLRRRLELTDGSA